VNKPQRGRAPRDHQRHGAAVRTVRRLQSPRAIAIAAFYGAVALGITTAITVAGKIPPCWLLLPVAAVGAWFTYERRLRRTMVKEAADRRASRRAAELTWLRTCPPRSSTPLPRMRTAQRSASATQARLRPDR